jgi:hypothetical protein
MQWLTWIGILFCISQSAMFSGLNLAFFSISRLRLELEAKRGSRDAEKVLAMRKDSNFLLTTILWGNVGINVLLTLLADSVLAGVAAFLFSTVLITFLGEIIPQAYFSRHALRMACLLAPILRIYQYALYPVAKTTAVGLDRWLGEEGIAYFRERDVRELLKLHMRVPSTGIDPVEGRGALNFLQIDDTLVKDEGEPIEPSSVIILSCFPEGPVFPEVTRSATDPFVQQVQASGENWIVITCRKGIPRFVLDADRFLRDVLFGTGPLHPRRHCRRPILVGDPAARLGELLPRLQTHTGEEGEDVMAQDIIVYWTDEERRIVTGSDILGRLLRGIATTTEGEYG